MTGRTEQGNPATVRTVDGKRAARSGSGLRPLRYRQVASELGELRWFDSTGALVAVFALGIPHAFVRRDESGQALIEYALVVSLIALVCVGVLSAVGVNVGTVLAGIAGDV